MKQIGVRELRQNASRWLARVAVGESFEVTDRGRPVARLVPVPEGVGLDALIAAGRARPATARLRDLPPPLPLPKGATPPSEVLRRLREFER